MLVASEGTPAPAEPLVVTAVKALVAIAAFLLLAGVGWQAWRPRSEDRS
jgi:hypothetical protein